MACRLQELGGPEIILVLPKTTEGWLEHKAMDGARHRLLHQLWKADRYKRLGVSCDGRRETDLCSCEDIDHG